MIGESHNTHTQTQTHTHIPRNKIVQTTGGKVRGRKVTLMGALSSAPPPSLSTAFFLSSCQAKTPQTSAQRMAKHGCQHVCSESLKDAIRRCGGGVGRPKTKKQKTKMKERKYKLSDAL